MKYFLHDSNSFQDEKITELFMAYGYEGLGLFYTVLEKLASQEKPIKTDVLKKQLFVGKKLEKCWVFMESLELISSNNGETFNKQLLNFSGNYAIKKEKNAKRISQWRDNQANTENVTRSEQQCNNNVTPIKISKVNISKVNISKEVEESLPNLNLPTAPFVSENEIIDINCFVVAFEKNEDLLQTITELHRCTKTQLSDYLKKFVLHKNANSESRSNYKDFLKHFNNWLRIIISAEKKEAKNGTYLESTDQQLKRINKTNPNRHPSASGDEFGGY